MQENILLMFLSDIKIVNKTGEIQKTHYTNLEDEDTEATNESAVRYLQQKGIESSKIFIIASEAVREGKIGGNYSEIKHLDYFKNRLKKFLPNIETIIIEYDENKSDEKEKENFKCVAEMAEKIQNYASDKDIVLHVDLTGGMRHINMMMLDVIRLLEYSEIKIGKIIYSNYNNKTKVGTVEEVKNIYDLFQLISGVEEFTNFGSVKSLKKYYDNHSKNISADLKNLLDAMENFAEAIKLCRYGQFKKSVEKLHDAINDFSVDEDNLNDVLMARFIGRIKQEYKMLIATRGQDDLKIIRWCLDKGYLQQALTLYTERIPEYIGENNFYEINSSELKKLQEKIGDDKRSKAFYFLNNYGDEELKNFQTEIENRVRDINIKYFKSIKKIVVPAILSENFSYEDWRKEFFENLTLPVDWISAKEIFADEEKIFKQLNLLNELKKDPKILRENIFDKKLEPIREIIDNIHEEVTKEKFGLQRLKKILKFIENSNLEKLKKYFPSFEFKAQLFRLQYMLEKKIFTLNIDRKIFLGIMEKYFRLKDERNHSNHANGISEFETAQDLEKFMFASLDEIEKITEEKNFG